MRQYPLGPLGAALVLALAGLPAGLAAQARSCDQVLPSDTRRIINAQGHELIYFRDPVRVLCTGGIRIEADSAVMNRSAGLLELVGQVVYVDGEQRLTAEWANYLGRSDELFARGRVVLTDLADGSVIRGDDLEYRRATVSRPESRMVVRGQVVHATLRSRPGTAAATSPDARDEPLEVWSRRMEFVGETLFIAQTDVRFQQGPMRGHSDHARFDQTAERMTLTGNAHVEDEAYTLDAHLIDAFLEGEALREVIANRDARLAADNLSVRSDRIRIGFQDGELERMEAWNPGTNGAPPERRALAVTEDFHLRADSIDARADAGRLREVRAVGRAFGEREAAEGAAALPDVIARDWIQGDTIIGYFAQETAAVVEPQPLDAPDASAGMDAPIDAADRTATVLEKIDVVGGSSTALSLYRMDNGDGTGLPSINFMRASRITLFMRDGAVTRVEADGPIDGLYLDPAPARPTGTDEARTARAGS